MGQRHLPCPHKHAPGRGTRAGRQTCAIVCKKEGRAQERGQPGTSNGHAAPDPAPTHADAPTVPLAQGPARAQPEAPAAPLPEAPVGITLKATLHGYDVMVTLRGVDFASV